MNQEEDRKIVKFNVGGTRYEVARSLIRMHPDTMLARIVSNEWQVDPSKEVFIERDGSRFKYVLDYLRDGKAFVPISTCKEALLNDLQYFGISYEEHNITLGKAQLYNVAQFVGGEIKNLEAKIKRSESKTNMLRFAHYCLLMVLKHSKQINSKDTVFIIDKSEESEFFDVCGKMSTVLRSKEAADFVQICKEIGFEPLRIDYSASIISHSYTVVLDFI